MMALKPTAKPVRERLRYDAVLKDLFQRDHPKLLERLTGGKRVKKTLNVELAMVTERRADLLLELDDDSLFLLDFQSGNDSKMPYRVGHYTLLGSEKYNRPVRPVVLYLGIRRMNMKAHLDAGGVVVSYSLIDIRDIDAETLLSGGPGDWALALLAKGGPERMREILAKALQLKSPKRERLLTQLTVLAGLRRLDKTIRMEMKQMSQYVDIQKNVILKDIWDEGKAEGAITLLTDLLNQRFGPLPAWASARLRKATPAQTQKWSRMVLSASTLEGVLEKR